MRRVSGRGLEACGEHGEAITEPVCGAYALACRSEGKAYVKREPKISSIHVIIIRFLSQEDESCMMRNQK